MALYRECRPARFKEIVAQGHVTRTLQNAIAQNRVAHAYLFCGPRGTGKTSTARVLAKALNCPNVADDEPCGVCEVCVGIAGGEGIDVVEMDAASNRGIDEIRTLRERVRLAPVGGRFKVYVIDEVHMLTTEAFNALLKTIEEPPANVVFVLCTTEAYRVPATIVSRCQRFDFHPISTRDIAGHLSDLIQKHNFNVEPAAARFIARVSTGSLRDALSILDQCLAYASGLVTLEAARNVVGALDGRTLVDMAGALIRGEAGEAFGGLERLMAEGRDPREVARGLAAHMRDLVLYRLSGQGPELIGPGADDPQALKAQAAAVSDAFLFEAVDVLSTAENEMRYAPQPRLALEARLLRLCSLTGGGVAGQGRAVLPAETTADRP
ncbi:MAG: DNA polymerase III, subunit gamma and tau, partial [Firmicutes bacterium RBG_13_65_8]